MPKHPGHRHASRLPCRFVVTIALTIALAGPAEAARHISFFEVARDDSEFADEVLRRYLEAKIDDIRFTRERFTYERVIESLARADEADQPFLARTTPYVFVVARTLGADLEILATYHGRAKDGTTYRSFFVVNRERLPGTGPITREELASWLRRRASDRDPARFVYHSKFSTSSYFVPSLFFRKLGIYAVPEPTGGPNEILSEKARGGSTDLVKLVAEGKADLAAVWNGTKAKFESGGEYSEIGREVAFIELATVIPNDLLVVPAGLDRGLKEKLRSAIAEMTEESLASFVTAREREEGKSLGDFRYWLDFRATDAERPARRSPVCRQ